MFEFITLIISLVASVLFTSYWVHHKYNSFLNLSISIISCIVTYILISLIWKDGAFIIAMIIGQATCLIHDWICKNCEWSISKLCIFLTSDIIWIPFLLCDVDVWEYAIYEAIIILCISLAPLSMELNEKIEYKLVDFYLERKIYYLIHHLLPCVTLFIDVLILMIIDEFTVLSAIIVSIIFILIFAIVLILQREIIAHLNSKYLNHAMMMWQSESRDYMNTIRSQRHDFNLHLHAVSGLINAHQYGECQKYVQNLVSQANDVNDIMPVCDPVVGSMLYNMRQKARKQGTDILYHITYDMADTLCNGFECNKIIGNLLQNAIDAMHSQEDKQYGIRLNILKRRGNTVIISENRFSGDPDSIARVFEPGYSTKKGHEGIGLSMILRTVQHYGGRIYPEFEDDKIRFIVNIPNKVNL